MTDFVKNNSIGRLFSVICVMGLFTQIGTVNAQNRGFYFGGGGAYVWNSTTSEDLAESYQNEYQRTLAGFLQVGVSFGQLGLGLEAGFEPRRYWTPDSNASDGTLAVDFSNIPLFLKLSYSTEGALSLRPNIFGGASISVRQGVPATTNTFGDVTPAKPAKVDLGVNAGAGVDIAWTIPGDHVSLFAGISYVFLAPMPLDTNSLKWFGYPLGRIGVTVHPFSSGGGGGSSGGSSSRSYSNSSSNNRIPAISTRPVMTTAATPTPREEAPPEKKPVNELLEAMREAEKAQQNQPAPTGKDLSEAMREAMTTSMVTSPPSTPPAQAAAPPPQTAAKPIDKAPAKTAAATAKDAKAIEDKRATVAGLKGEVVQQKNELASIGDNPVIDKKTLDEIRKSTGDVRTVQLKGGAAENPVSAGAKLDTVYFFPDMSKPMIMYSLPIVDEVGRKLQQNKDLVVSIRGYAAPAGTKDGQMIISESRARYCAEYLSKNFGISYDRMTIEWYGSSKKPEGSAAYNKEALYRAVELVVRPQNTLTWNKDNVEITQGNAPAKK